MSHLSRSPEDAVAVRAPRAAMAGRNRLLLLLLLLLPTPATRAFAPRISLPLGECWDGSVGARRPGRGGEGAPRCLAQGLL